MAATSIMMPPNPTGMRRAHRGLPARPLSKDMTNLPVSGWQHQQNHSMASKPAAARPMSSSPADQAHFAGFVRLLASKDEHQRAILVQRALTQAENVSSAISSGRFTEHRPLLGDEAKGLRRASSADNLRRRPTSPHPQNNSAARLLARRQEAALAHREAASMPQAHGWLVPPPEEKRLKEQAAMLARRQREQARVFDAAATLQAHWRGRQHRRVCRFLRARRARLIRLDWLDHLEWTRCLMNARGAAAHIQATWRAVRVRRQLSPKDVRTRELGRPAPLAPPAPASRGTAAVKAKPQLSSGGEAKPAAPKRKGLTWAPQLSEIRTYDVDSRPPVVVAPHGGPAMGAAA